MGDLTTDRLPDMLRLPDMRRLPDMGRLPDMARQKAGPRPEALPDIRPRPDMDLPLHPHPARPDRRLCPHRAARAASRPEKRGQADRGERREGPLLAKHAPPMLLAHFVGDAHSR
jgi:hypothetical protein